VTEGSASQPLGSYYGFKMYCYAASCNLPAITTVKDVDVTASETQGPGLVADGSNNLWYQTGHYVWNPAGNPWSIASSASDPSGVCNMGASVNGHPLQGPLDTTPETDSFQQCPSPVSWTDQTATVDTNQYVPAGTSGPLSLQLNAGNAAGVVSNPSETLNVDNVQPTVTLTTPNDANPSAWVNHAVTVDATAHTGPSGLGSLTCSIDHRPAQLYPAAGLTVDGNGVHTVSCTAANNAVDPQGQPNTGTSPPTTIKIDEMPPTAAFEPVVPSDPDQLVVDTTDTESGVAGGQIQIARAGTAKWTALPTAFDGQHLLATANDARLRGPYTIQATSCDYVGNCATTDETLAMPLRLGAVLRVSFAKILVPAKVITERVRIGFHSTLKHHGHALVRVNSGGRYVTIKVVVGMNQHCGHRLIKIGPRKWREFTACRKLNARIVTDRTFANGKPTTVHGLLQTPQGAPIANAPIAIVTSALNGLSHFRDVRRTTTNADGGWTVMLDPGPSRVIYGAYAGSATVRPATGKVVAKVPAEIGITISPRVLPWSEVVTIRGHLEGGYVPRDGVALRLLVRYPHTPRASQLLALRTNKQGEFKIEWTYGAGRGVATYPMSIGTTATESDYPFMANNSRWIDVTFTPTPARHPLAGLYRGKTSQHQTMQLGISASKTRITSVKFGMKLKCSRRTYPTYIFKGPVNWKLNASRGFGFSSAFGDNTGGRYQMRGTFTPAGSVAGTLAATWRTPRYGSCASGTIKWSARSSQLTPAAK
jgi:hypothetical protein